MGNKGKIKKIIINKFVFMFEHRFSKFGRAFLLAAGLLLMGGLQQSCKDWLDDYKYDDSEPEWLGASIYAFLQEGTPSHTYKNYVELIDSLGETPTLSKTGSKTLFVADDKAFDRFFENNAWGVKSIAEMSVAQRKYLFYNAMLSNAILLDMMPNTSEKSEGDCISHATEFNPLDSVPLVHGKYYPLHASWPTYNMYWDEFSLGKDTLLISMTSSSIVHFFDEYLKRNAVSVDDVNFIFQKGGDVAKNYEKGDVFLYGNKLVDSEVDAGGFSEDSLTISCKNGYIYRMDEVLLPPMDMASELRNREDTRIFSHLLDRFCIPVFNSDLTDKYRIYHNSLTDSVYSLNYFTKSKTNAGASFTGKNVVAPKEDACLAYDPAAAKSKNDIYAMLVPKDEFLYDYFANPEDGAGNFLIKNYAPDVEVEENYSKEAVDGLLVALDSIPQVSIATFLNNLMQESFTATVPSKFDRITDDANDDMNIEKQHVDECLIANNGVIYLLNKVFSPAAYSSVAGPVDIYDNMSIMKNFIKDLKYNYYLLAMDADYTLIVPDNENFVYYDPMSYDNYTKEGKMKMYSFHYDGNCKKNTNKTPELWNEEFQIDKTTLKIDTLLNENTGYNQAIATDILEYLIIVHDKVEPAIHKDRMYYSTKGYGTIKVDASDPENVKFYGGEQLEKGTEIVSSMIINQENGVTYCTAPAEVTEDPALRSSSVPTPPMKSVYQNMLANGENPGDIFYEFFQLCNPGSTLLESVLKSVYGATSLKQDTVKLYSIFYTGGDMKNSVPFFNTYHYTVYVPSNESIAELYEQGLPTWDMIEEEMKNNPKRALSMLRLVNNFARYHFQDQSVYHDRSAFFTPNVDGGKDYEASLSTSLLNNTTGRFYELKVKSDDIANPTTILVQDEWAKNGKAALAKVITIPAENENKTWNLMCRDRQGTTTIKTSSYAVIQPIDRALLNSNLFGFDGRIARYAITGERVDTIWVPGGKEGMAGFAENCYLVAKAGRVPRSTKDEPQPADLENKEIAYLMRPVDSSSSAWNDCYAHEELVLDADELPILITNEGYRVVKTETVQGIYKTIAFEYYTVQRNGNEYIFKVDNAGNEIPDSEKLYKEKEVETPETPEAPETEDNGSNGETSDEE